jgi:hypothetical protein
MKFTPLGTTVGLVIPALAMTLSLFAVVTQAVALGPARGDIAVWSFTHEWLSRGATLYGDVWDHKDWGFFALYSPFYSLDSVRGLYVGAVLVTVAFGLGVFLVIRELGSQRFAIVVASISLTAYVCAPSYLSTYTENAAIALATLAVGLVLRFPLVAGAILASSCSIKISGFAVFAAVLGVLVLADLGARRARRQRGSLSSSVKLFTGFLAGAATIGLAAAATGGLAGWVDTVAYNREYLGIRRLTTGVESGLIGWLQNVLPSFNIFVSMAVLGVCLTAGLLAVIGMSRRPAAETRPSERHWLLFFVTLAFAAAALVTLAVQVPLRFQHFQYVVGPLLLLLGVLSALLWQLGKSHATEACALRAGVLSVVLLAVPLAAHSGIVPGDRLVAVGGAVDRWRGLSQPGPLAEHSANFEAGSSVAVIGWSGWLDLSDAPPSITLACRHFYHYAHLLPRYGKEIESCLANALPDIFIVSDQRYGSSEYTGLVDRVLEDVRTTHNYCGPTGTQYRIWVRNGSSCPVP